MIETVRVSGMARDQLIALKRRTKIPNWNTLCRWAFCRSLSESGIPSGQSVSTEDSTEASAEEKTIEIKWGVFGGTYASLYWALLRERCRQDELDIDDETLAEQFKLHLHRGIGSLFGDRIRNVEELIENNVPELKKKNPSGGRKT